MIIEALVVGAVLSQIGIVLYHVHQDNQYDKEKKILDEEYDAYENGPPLPIRPDEATVYLFDD